MSAEGAGLEALIRDLRDPRAYPRPAGEVGLVETHISCLFFAGDRVYKVKKPVRLEFLDFSSKEARRHACEEEVRLNARLAPGVYHGVVPLTREPGGHLRIGGEGDAEDFAVEMERLPAERMLDALLERGEVDNRMMSDLAEVLARFHEEADAGAEVRAHGEPEAVRKLILGNLEELDRLGPGQEDAPLGVAHAGFLRRAAESRLEAAGDLLAERARGGRIREGHGDLHAGNICFTEKGLRIYDTIEFRRDFRCADVAADLAFLAMDLDERGCSGFGRYLVRAYREQTGDDGLEPLLDLYKGYRACVRGKVAWLTARGGRDRQDVAEEHRARATRSFTLAASYELPQALLLMSGLPGTGKSGRAALLSRLLRFPWWRSDVQRKRLAGIAPTRRASAAYGEGLYAAELGERTYESLLAQARESLAEGRGAVVDASFSTRALRAPFLRLAEEQGVPLFLVLVEAGEEEVRRHLERRSHDAREVSDADLEIHREARDRFEPPDEVPPEQVVRTLAGGGGPEQALRDLLERWCAEA